MPRKAADYYGSLWTLRPRYYSLFHPMRYPWDDMPQIWAYEDAKHAFVTSPAWSCLLGFYFVLDGMEHVGPGSKRGVCGLVSGTVSEEMN